MLRLACGIASVLAFVVPHVVSAADSNLAAKRPAQASSEETGKNNLVAHAVDGDPNTRWCASNGSTPQWWQVDLGSKQKLSAVRIQWEQPTGLYRYSLLGSDDGQTWRTLVDREKDKRNDKQQGVTTDQLKDVQTRYVRVLVHGTRGGWASIREFTATDGKLPKLVKPPVVAQGDVKISDDFKVAIFGVPPEVNYPVCISAAPTGELFVGVDPQGSLGKKPDQGKILRCRDTDGDGIADKINVFAKADHPRGLVYDAGKLWVLHPPRLTLFEDTDGDGTADQETVLVENISTDFVNKRGADHTTNGIRMGIDGWIYIALGDFGLINAKGVDGRTLTHRGGGVVRVRPDGTEMELYCVGLRNILDVAIDPYLDMFTRDNTNDGGGWDVRVSHIQQSANYGYPSQYLHFSEEIMPPLGQYGGGSGCGAMYLHDLRWPAPFGDAAYTCDWGRSVVYRHTLERQGPTFSVQEEPFIKVPRPTDIDVDGSGRMYVSSWKNGKFNYSGPDVGFVAQIVPKDFTPEPFPNLSELDAAPLVALLKSQSAVHRLHAQREILRREDTSLAGLVEQVARDSDATEYARVAAIFTLKQLQGAASHSVLLELAGDKSVREFALRALTDRKSQLEGVTAAPLIAALEDADPRVRAQAVTSLGRLGDPSAVGPLLPLAERSPGDLPPTTEPVHAQPDSGRVIPHLAIKAIVATGGVEPCLAALDGPHAQTALRALQQMHAPETVAGLVARYSKTRDTELRTQILTTLVRLYHQEGPYESGWWGTRPDTRGPYYARAEWDGSPAIAKLLTAVSKSRDRVAVAHLAKELARHHVKIDGISIPKDAGPSEEPKPIVVTIPKADPNNPNQIGNRKPEEVAAKTAALEGDAQRGAALFKSQACVACHSYAPGQKPVGPHLADIGKRYKTPELIESILKPSAKIAQGFDTYAFLTVEGKVVTGFMVSESDDAVEIRQTDGKPVTLAKEYIDERVRQAVSSMPQGLVNNLTPEQLADLVAYLKSLH